MVDVERACAECGESFTGHGNRRYCSKRCAKRKWRRHEVETGAYRAQQLRHRARHPEQYTYEHTRESRRRHDLKRNAAKRGASIEGPDFTLQDIIDRDGLACSLCGELIDRSLAWPDRMSLTLDHVLPISLGGAHHRDNVGLAHLTCNSSKRHRVG